MKRAKTDADLRCESKEFVWNQDGLTDAHHYILPSLIGWLKEWGAERVLDLGCGNGALTHQLAHNGFQITGTDCSESGIAIATESYPDVDFHKLSVEDSLPEPLRRRFDAVIAVEVIEHLLLPRMLFEQAKQALRPGGTLIVTTPYHGYLKNLALAVSNRFDDHWHPLRDYGHVKFFSSSTLVELFQERGFSVNRIHRVGRIPALAKSMIVQGTLPQ